jgi:O-antigen/teichoic acid export membrane protein
MAESLSRKSLFITVMNLLGAIIAYLGFFVIARYMPQGEQVIGLVTFSTGYLSVFLPISRLGFPQAHTKKVSEGSDLAVCNGAFLIITVLLTLLMSAVVIATIIIWVYLLHRGFETKEELDAIWIMFGYNIVISFANVPITTFSARREMVKSQLGTFAGHIARVVAIVFVVFSGLSGLDIVWAYFIGGAASLAASLYLLSGYPFRWPHRAMLSDYYRFSRPLVVPTILATLPLGLAPVLIQYYWHLIYTGYFGSAYRIVAVFIVLGQSVASVIFPKISELHSQGSFSEIRMHTMEAEKLLAFILAPLSFFLLIYSPGIIHVLLKNTFLGAVSSLWALSLWLYVTGISQPKSNLIPAMNRPSISGMITSVSSIVSVVLMLFLIPRDLFGFRLPGLADFGASLALLAGAVVSYGISNYYSNRISGTRFSFAIIIFPAIAVLSCLAVFPLTYVFGQLNWVWYIGLLFVFLIAAIYLLICLLSRAIEPGEIKLILDALNPLEMRTYVSSELSSRYNGKQ